MDKRKTASRSREAVRCEITSKSALGDLQNLHGAYLNADAAGNALGSRSHAGLADHDPEGAGSLALATADAELLVDHVNTGLGILGDGTLLAGSYALAALDAGHGTYLACTLYDLNAGLVLMEFLVESLGTGTDALQTSHALGTLFNCKLFHNNTPLCIIFILPTHYIKNSEKINSLTKIFPSPLIFLKIMI